MTAQVPDSITVDGRRWVVEMDGAAAQAIQQLIPNRRGRNGKASQWGR